jgi:hypothetical protein
MHAIETTLYLLSSRDFGMREEFHMRCLIQGRGPPGNTIGDSPSLLVELCSSVTPTSLSAMMGLAWTFRSFFISAGNPAGTS